MYKIMTKRKNPFDDSHFLQKLHVGVKEVNLGVNHVENMKKVYENTMKMLYDGSVSNQNGYLKLQNEKPFQNGNPVLQNGGVSHADDKVSNGILQPVSNKQEKAALMNPCCMSNVPKYCSFCEKIMCNICLRVCENCDNEFCHLCSILQYDSQEETAICLSCM